MRVFFIVSLLDSLIAYLAPKMDKAIFNPQGRKNRKNKTKQNYKAECDKHCQKGLSKVLCIPKETY